MTDDNPAPEDSYIWVVSTGAGYYTVVSTGAGYYAESDWTTEEAAWEEARRIPPPLIMDTEIAIIVVDHTGRYTVEVLTRQAVVAEQHVIGYILRNLIARLDART